MRRRYLATAAVGLGLLAFGLKRASTLPPPVHGRAVSPPRGEATPLDRATVRAARRHRGRSGIHMLADAHDAFAARMLLVREAKRTLDLQYYIWHGDRSGTLLLNAVYAAARRGVRVRMLLDDNGIAGMDRVLSGVNRHPNIEVRLFNPFAIRFPKALGFAFDFKRLNRRMHNKSLTVDGVATIVGGRNIGDEYFGSGEAGLYGDLDVLAIGPVVADVAADFERYWTSQSAYPAEQILGRVNGRMVRKLRRAAVKVERDPASAAFMRRIRDLPIVRLLVEGTLPMEWAPVRLLSDDPAKGLDRARPDGLLAGRLEKAIGRPRRKLGIITGYFVPGPQGARWLAALARHGVDVSVLTNSYEAGDVSLVHAGYAPSRRTMLEGGVRLFELRASGTRGLNPREGVRVGVGSRLRGTGTGSTAALRSGVTTLHAKTFTVDDRKLFIGSFNLDPRSWQLNTEMGFVIESPRLARKVAEVFDHDVPLHAYELQLGNGIEWVERGARLEVHRREPGMSRMTAAVMGLLRVLPIRWLL
ncbi:phospholipase D family protein [Falsirhodobacter sp. 20TX0035]|uniref:phospholipase D family protein n=1 Tax=Falsirhodobacter sp. 20TX0035 TaxID=3022019 RepID=UPI0023314B81|nr:phospholipase D family protein [Falsirhodobacter sp. 20TX0035]MDB6452855.1 phospholipase D family protein [Falsirhodobacter sp. 20TX0035]